MDPWLVSNRSCSCLGKQAVKFPSGSASQGRVPGCKLMLLCLSEAPTPDPKSSNVTLSPLQKEELAKMRRRQLANAVQYIWETGEDKYMLRYFHTGFWLSCEKHNEGLRTFSVSWKATSHERRCH